MRWYMNVYLIFFFYQKETFVILCVTLKLGQEFFVKKHICPMIVIFLQCRRIKYV